MANNILNISTVDTVPQTVNHRGLEAIDVIKKTRAALVACMLGCAMVGGASAQTNPNNSVQFAGLDTSRSLVSSSPSATLQVTKSPEHGQWNEIFEKNKILSQTNKELAKSEKAEWKNIPGMMDAWREWKESDNDSGRKTIIAKKTEDSKLNETVITKNIENEQLLAGNAKATETIITLETKIRETNFLTSLISLQSTDTSLLDQIKNALSSTFSALRNHPLLSDMFTAILTDPKCPPLRSEHLVAIQKWLEANKAS